LSLVTVSSVVLPSPALNGHSSAFAES
jgi:hypothetical protein